MQEDIASVAELARALGISEVAVLKRIKRGTVEATKVDRKWHIPRSEVERLTNPGPNPSKPNPDADRPNQTLTVREAREAALQQDLAALTTENEILRGKLESSEVGHDATRRELDTVREALQDARGDIAHLQSLSTSQSESISALTTELQGLTAIVHTRRMLDVPLVEDTEPGVLRRWFGGRRKRQVRIGHA